jgi:hypothetical protein
MRLSCSSLAKPLGQEASRGRLYCFVYTIGLGLDDLPLVYEVKWRNSMCFLNSSTRVNTLNFGCKGLSRATLWYHQLFSKKKLQHSIAYNIVLLFY